MRSPRNCFATRNRFAICIDNSEYPAPLEKRKVYRIVPDKEVEREGDLPVNDESGEDYIFPASYFLVVELPVEKVRVLKKSYVTA